MTIETATLKTLYGLGLFGALFGATIGYLGALLQ